MSKNFDYVSASEKFLNYKDYTVTTNYYLPNSSPTKNYYLKFVPDYLIIDARGNKIYKFDLVVYLSDFLTDYKCPKKFKTRAFVLTEKLYNKLIKGVYTQIRFKRFIDALTEKQSEILKEYFEYEKKLDELFKLYKKRGGNYGKYGKQGLEKIIYRDYIYELIEEMKKILKKGIDKSYFNARLFKCIKNFDISYYKDNNFKFNDIIELIKNKQYYKIGLSFIYLFMFKIGNPDHMEIQENKLTDCSYYFNGIQKRYYKFIDKIYKDVDTKKFKKFLKKIEDKRYRHALYNYYLKFANAIYKEFEIEEIKEEKKQN